MGANTDWDEGRRTKSVSDYILDNTKRQRPSYYDQVMHELYGGRDVKPVPVQPNVKEKFGKAKPKRLAIPVEDDTLLGGFSGLGRISEQEARRYDKHMADLGITDSKNNDQDEFI